MPDPIKDLAAQAVARANSVSADDAAFVYSKGLEQLAPVDAQGLRK